MGPIIGEDQLEAAEVDLLEVLLHNYGFDYRTAAPSSLRQKIARHVGAEHLQTVKGLREKVFHDEECRQRLFHRLTLAADAMFFEPAFYQGFRAAVVPLLRTYPFIRIWHVGCSTGEEVYSMAILLEEEGIYDRCRLYATDIDDAALRRGRDGIYPFASIQEYTENYLRSGGRAALSEYYTPSHDQAIIHPSLKRNIIFAQHNLATDGAFNDFQVILCRGVLPTLATAVQERGHELFRNSLVRLGFLCLGAGELVNGAGTADYEAFATGGIFRRIY